MKTWKAITAGIILWIFVFSSFTILDFIPQLKGNTINIVMFVLVIPYAYVSSSFYYKNGDQSNALLVGSVISLTALLLDVIITVPFVEIPNHGSYYSFFTSPVLWTLIAENLAVVYLYKKLKADANTK